MAPRTDPHWLSFATLAIGLFSVGPVGVVAQTSTAVCLSSFNWMDNSKSQNPCLVSAYLQGACNGGQFTVDPLPSGTHYIGPYADDINECQCSSVTYNTISACGLCQNCTIIRQVIWSSWYYNCTTIYPGVIPAGIPDGTAVPAWAFQDVTTSNLFNVTLAQSVGDNPESTASSTQTTFSVGATSISASLTNSPSTSSTSGSSSGKSSDTGAIAGGVVGGVVGVALIAGVAVFFIKKNRSRALPSAQLVGHQTSPVYPPPDHMDPTHLASQMAQPKFYDPSDPSTFPTSPPATIVNASSNNVRNPTVSYASLSRHSGYYSGAPEV